MSTRVMLTVAGLNLREAVGTRVAAGAAAVALIVFGVAQFASALSLAEAESTRAVLAASGLRLGYVVVLTLFVASSMSREAEDKWLEVLLSLPLARWQLLLARLLGYAAVAVVLVLVSSLVLVWLAPLANLAVWMASFLAELLVVLAFTVFCMSSLRNLTLTVLTVLAFYLCARTIAALQLIAHAPIGETGGLNVFAQWVLDGVALLLPRLDLYTNASWLVADTSFAALTPLLGQSALYVTLIAAATLFDAYRRNH